MCSTDGFWMHPEELEAMKKASKIGVYRCQDCGKEFKAVRKETVSCPGCNSPSASFVKPTL